MIANVQIISEHVQYELQQETDLFSGFLQELGTKAGGRSTPQSKPPRTNVACIHGGSPPHIQWKRFPTWNTSKQIYILPFWPKFILFLQLSRLSLCDTYQLWFSASETWLRRSALSKLRLWLMDQRLSSRLLRPMCRSPQNFSLICGLRCALRVQRSTIVWNMACFSVYFSFGKQNAAREGGFRMRGHKFTAQQDDSDLPGLHWQSDRCLICGLTGAS